MNDFQPFFDRVVNDASLRARLKPIPDLETLLARVVELGREQGFDFDRESVNEVIVANRKAWIERWIQR